MLTTNPDRRRDRNRRWTQGLTGWLALLLLSLPTGAFAEYGAVVAPVLAMIGRVGNYLGYWAGACFVASVVVAVCLRDR